MNVTTTTIRDHVEDKQFHAALQWICLEDYSAVLRDYRDKVQTNTGQWFLQHSCFKAWVANKASRVLFCPGQPGTGKTILSTIATNYLESRPRNSGEVVICLFCDYKRRHEQTVLHFMKSMLRQLLHATHSLPVAVRHMHEKHKKERTNPGIDELRRVLQDVMHILLRVWIIVDALDECDQLVQTLLWAELQAFAKQANTALLVTSRPLSKVQQLFLGVPEIEIIASEVDIKQYAMTRIQAELQSFDWSDTPLRNSVTQAVATAADGRYVIMKLD